MRGGETVQLDGEIFATTWHVTVVAADAEAAARARALAPRLQEAFSGVGRALSAWDPQSELSVFNRAASTSPQPVSPATARLVSLALDVAARTDGAFDPTLGPLLSLWGFSAATKGTVTTPPSPDAIAAARARTGPSFLQVDGLMLQKQREDLVVDLTAIGDGAAAAAGAAVVRDAGFVDVLVDVGGEIAACGHGPAGPWRVGIDAPSNDPLAAGAVVAVAALDAGAGGCRALSTSGSTREAWSAGARRYPHILDPRSGTPIDHDLVSCTIVVDDVVVADALSTACMVLGEAGTRAVLPRFAGASAFFVRAPKDDDRALVTSTSEGFPTAR